MFSSTVKRLTILSPSSSTISYTVSNALPRTTRASKLLGTLGDVLRVLLCIFVLGLDLTALQKTTFFPFSLHSSINEHQNKVLHFLSMIVNSLDWRLLTAGSVALLYLCLRKGYTGKPQQPPSLRPDRAATA